MGAGNGAAVRQLLIFGQSILLGLSVGLFYDLLRAFRLRLPRITSWLDALYCLAAGGSVFLFLLRRSSGELRGFVLLGIAGGCALFFSAFSQPLRPLWAFWTETLAWLARLLALPVLWTRQLCKKIAFCGKNLFYFWRKCFTIEIDGHRNVLTRGGGGHNKAGKAAKAGKAGKGPKGRTADSHRPDGQAGYSGAADRRRLASVRASGPIGKRPAGAGRRRRGGGNPAPEE